MGGPNGGRSEGTSNPTDVSTVRHSLEDMIEDARAASARRKPLKGSPGLKARIVAAADYIDSMRDVVPIRTDLDVLVEDSAGDDEKLDRLAKRRRLESPVRRLREARASAGSRTGRGT